MVDKNDNYKENMENSTILLPVIEYETGFALRLVIIN